MTLTGQELSAYRAAAAADGMAVAAWLARAGNEQASELSVPASAELRRAVAEFAAAARYAKSIVRQLNSAGVPGPRMAPLIRLSERALARIDEAILAVTDALP